MFKKLFGSLSGKKKEAVPIALASQVSESILSIVGARSIPPMPGNAQKAFQLSINPSADARDFVELIKSDEAMSARMLRVANSVYFDRGKKSTSIEEGYLETFW